ncbi:MAG: hypothetical protein NZM07_08460, partial [Elioraea sp.]|nr:hypothetical protein [Elioraea sp.]
CHPADRGWGDALDTPKKAAHAGRSLVAARNLTRLWRRSLLTGGLVAIRFFGQQTGLLLRPALPAEEVLRVGGIVFAVAIVAALQPA